MMLLGAISALTSATNPSSSILELTRNEKGLQEVTYQAVGGVDHVGSALPKKDAQSTSAVA